MMYWPLIRLLPKETHFKFVSFAPIAAVLSDGTRRAPDAVGSDGSNIYAFWYSLVPKSVTLELTSRVYAAAAVQVSLPLGSVRSVVMPFRKLPTATVTLDLPAEFPRQHAAMQVWHRGEMVRVPFQGLLEASA